MADVNNLERRAAALSKPSAKSVVGDGHSPAVRKGEDSMTSRPFSFTKMIGAIAGVVPRESAKVEIDLLGGFRKALDETNSMIQGGSASATYYPGARSLLPYDAAFHKGTSAMLESAASCGEVDRDQMLWEARRIDAGMVEKGYEPRFVKTAMSYLTDTIGGTLVPPAEMGELIPLMRNQSAVDRAGGRMVPLPPQGKWVAPRVTSATSGYWIGENTNITESNPQTGQVEMMAKKLAVLVRVPNELFKYASVSADAMLREDIAKTLSLGYDYSILYGKSGAQPKGLVNYTGTNELLSYTATGVGTDGNTLYPEDGYKMAAAIEDRNFKVDGQFKWIMRPKLWGKVASFRSSSGATTTADQFGLFVQDLTRLVGAKLETNWTGYEVVRSAQIRADLTKGSGTGLTEVFGGLWNEMLMGMYGAIEFASNPLGEATFTQDQTLIRGILHCDSVPRYPGAFVRCSDLIQS
jgi:HK97 family phage major capsid protein